MGGNSFAFTDNTGVYNTYYLVNAFDHNDNTQYVAYHNTINTSSPHIITMYSPELVNVTSMYFKNRTLDNQARGIDTGYIQCSSDGSTYETVKTFSGLGSSSAAGATYTITCPNSKRRKYWRICITNCTGGSAYIGFCEIRLYGYYGHTAQLDELYVSPAQSEYFIKY